MKQNLPLSSHSNISFSISKYAFCPKPGVKNSTSQAKHLISEKVLICTPIIPRNTIYFSAPIQVKTQQFLPVSASEACVRLPVCTNPRAAINCSCQDFQQENSGQVIKKVKLFPIESEGNFQLALNAQVLNFSFATLIITTQLQWPSVLK